MSLMKRALLAALAMVLAASFGSASAAHPAPVQRRHGFGYCPGTECDHGTIETGDFGAPAIRSSTRRAKTATLHGHLRDDSGVRSSGRHGQK
jgi:hypothetical protein